MEAQPQAIYRHGYCGQRHSSVHENLSEANASFDNQLRNVNTSAASVINQGRVAPPPDYLGTALGIGGDIGDYLRYRQFRAGIKKQEAPRKGASSVLLQELPRGHGRWLVRK